MRHSGAVVSTVASQQACSMYEPAGQRGPFCMEFAWSKKVLMIVVDNDSIVYSIIFFLYFVLGKRIMLIKIIE